MKWTKKVLAVGGLALGFVMLATMPASAQVETLYTGGGARPPAIAAPGGGGPGAASAAGPVGAVLSTSGGAPAGAVLATGGGRAVPTQVLASQTSGAVAATSQAPVQRLAFTGADIVTLVTIGLSLAALGVVLTRRARALPQN